MTGKLLMLASAVAFAACPTTAAAQEVEPTLINDITPQFEAGQEERRQRERAEDTTVLSAILREDLAKLYPADPHAALAARGAFEPGGAPEIERVGKPLGEYLPGYGLIVQVEAPAPLRPRASKEQPDAEPAPPTRWEATRRRLRGEASATAGWGQSCKVCHVVEAKAAIFNDWRDAIGSSENRSNDAWRRNFHAGAAGPTAEQVTATLVHILAENGRHLRHLQPDERVTLSLHYRAAAPDPLEKEGWEPSHPAPADAAPDEETTPRGAERPATASNMIDLLLHEKLQRLAPSSRAVRGRISVTAAKRHLDAVAAGALTRDEFQKHTVIRVHHPE